MCGFAGVLSDQVVSRAQLQRMNACLTFRGPDGEGYWNDAGIGLAHRRLAVIDLNDRASQPMVRDGSAMRIVYNGEIYNFQELKRELEQLGETFRTTSDTEVLLAGFHRWRHAMWPKLRGMFACAIWDERSETLTLARDPLGKKPLFWTMQGRSLLFSSSLSSLRAGMSRAPAIDRAAINGFLADTVVPGNTTIYSGVFRLPPAHYAEVRAGAEPRPVRYWRLSYASKIAVRGDDAIEEITRLLERAVERRLISDVPVGAFLSGGFDSGLVVAAIKRIAGSVRTFTAGAPGSASDERALAAAVARYVGAEHTEIILEPGQAGSLPRLLMEAGQPFGDASILPTFGVARAARQHVTVALTGDGGDEGFFGYTSFQGVLAADMLRRVVPFPSALGALGALIDGAGHSALRRRASHVMKLASGNLADTLYNPMGFTVEQRARILRGVTGEEADAPERRHRAAWLESDGEDATEKAAGAFIETTMVDGYLVKLDTATMAASLEARSPFLDIDLLMFLASLPRRVKFPLGHRKHLLRPLVRRWLPPEILTQPKRGFNLPVDEWLRGPLRGAFDKYVCRPQGAMAELIDGGEARRLLDRHLAGENHATRLWALFTLGVWTAMSLDGTIEEHEQLGVWMAA